MTTSAKSACHELLAWLRLNLGRGALAPLTGTDFKALAAALHILELHAYAGGDGLLRAFREVVLQMQPSTREFAYHAIAHVLDWSDRAVVWERAGLEPLTVRQVCSGEAIP